MWTCDCTVKDKEGALVLAPHCALCSAHAVSWLHRLHCGVWLGTAAPCKLCCKTASAALHTLCCAGLSVWTAIATCSQEGSLPSQLPTYTTRAQADCCHTVVQAASIIPADSNSLAYLRTVAEVTNIVSGFFPAGLSGLSK